MERHLLLVRHAKSSWDDAGLADRDRPLSARGMAALAVMRGHLERLEHPVDLVVCSPSRRTLATLDGIRPALADDVRIEVEAALYGAGSSWLVGRLRSAAGDVRGLMVVGHNPTLQDVALALVGRGAPAARRQLGEKFPTGAIASISFDGDWADLAPGGARLDDLFLPREPRPTRR